MRKHALLTTALLLPAIMAFSAGFQLNMQGLRQLAMGGGGMATPWDVLTIFYNPGGLSRLDGMQVYGSVQPVIPWVEYVNDASNITARTQSKVFTPFNFYAGGAVKGVSGLGVGIGVYTPFGSGTYWEDNWTGRYAIQHIELQTFFFQPTVSYKFCDAVSIGAGYIYAIGKVKVAQAIPAQSLSGQDGQASLSGNAKGMGYNVGISFKASERLLFGISYRSRVDMHSSDGSATFTTPASVASNFPNTSFDATLPCPEVLSVGASWKPLEHLTLQADFNLTGWKAYDTLAFNYAVPVNGTSRTASARLYKNRIASRIGAHYQASEHLAIMIGGAYDPSPVQDNYVTPDLPDANRIVMTGGFTYKFKCKVTLLAAFEYATSERRDGTSVESNLSGRYQTKGITPALGATYDF